MGIFVQPIGVSGQDFLQSEATGHRSLSNLDSSGNLKAHVLDILGTDLWYTNGEALPGPWIAPVRK